MTALPSSGRKSDRPVNVRFHPLAPGTIRRRRSGRPPGRNGPRACPHV